MSGVLLVVIGLVFLASNLGTVPEVNVARLWPVIVVVIGVGRILSPNPDENRWNGLVLIFIAGIFLAHNYDVMRLRDSWPLFIVGAGLSVLLNVAAGRPNRNERKPS
jgi:hypothetical protein